MGLVVASSKGQVTDIIQLERELTALELASERDARIDAYMEEVIAAGTPIVENDTTVLFVYQGPETDIRISGDMTHWAGEIQLANVTGTDLFYVRGVYPTNARLEYLLLRDDKPPTPDPLCPNSVRSGFGANSELRMPGYADHPILASVGDSVLGDYNRVQQHLLPAGILGYATEIHVYTPPGYESSATRFPTVYLQDGQDYIEYAYTPGVLDQLIESGTIEPVIAVFISPPNRHQPDTPNRTTEYGLNPDYARFMAEELVPYVEHRYRSIDRASARLVAGPSFGGLISAYVPFMHSDVFGLGYSQSGYLSFRSDALIKAYQEHGRRPIRLYVDIGTFEQSIGQGWLPDDEIDFLAANRRFREMLAAKGYDFVYREYPAFPRPISVMKLQVFQDQFPVVDPWNPTL